jgi:plasmid stabilization system protein ParE
MMDLIWLTEAAEDLEEIFDYYVTLNPRAAAKMYNANSFIGCC